MLAASEIQACVQQKTESKAQPICQRVCFYPHEYHPQTVIITVPSASSTDIIINININVTSIRVTDVQILHQYLSVVVIIVVMGRLHGSALSSASGLNRQ